MANTPSITAKAGRSFLLKVSDGTSPNTYTTVSGLRTTGLVINGNPVDITNKGSGGWRELLPGGGVANMDVDCAGIEDAQTSSNSALQLVERAARELTLIEAVIVSGKGDKYFGLFAVSNFRREGPHDNAEAYSFTLQSSGPPVYSAS